MSLFKTKHQKKSAIITAVINALLIVLLFFFGLTYLDPPPQNGIMVNLGTSEVGSGNVQPTEPVKSAPEQKTSQPEPQPQEPQPEPEPQKTSSAATDEAVTQDNEQAPVVDPKKEEENQPEKEDKKEPKPEKKEPKEEKPKTEPEKQPKEEKPEKKPDPKPNQSTSDALNSVMNGQKKDGKAQEGEGNDNQAGDKGKEDGDPNADSYYGNGSGNQGNGNYRLAGRKALQKKKFVQDCNESGTVVVQIQVNQKGEVIKATPGAKGTTNSSPCLTEPAKKAALQTTFNQDANAPARQTGTIIYEFKLSE